MNGMETRLVEILTLYFSCGGKARKGLNCAGAILMEAMAQKHSYPGIRAAMDYSDVACGCSVVFAAKLLAFFEKALKRSG